LAGFFSKIFIKIVKKLYGAKFLHKQRLGLQCNITLHLKKLNHEKSNFNIRIADK